MKVKYKCAKCRKPIEWELSLWKRIKWLCKGKSNQKVCKECYEKKWNS